MSNYNQLVLAPYTIPRSSVSIPPYTEQPPVVDGSGIPEYAPPVFFDVRLGRENQYVDFDYETFQAEATSVGMNLLDQVTLPCHVTVPGKWWSTKGSGQYDEGGITVGVGKKANDTFIHELRHAADDATGVLEHGKVDYLRYRASRFTLNLLVKMPFVSAGLIGTSLAGNELATRVVNSPYAIAPPLLLYAVWKGGYYFSPDERRARKAARESSATILTVIKR